MADEDTTQPAASPATMLLGTATAATGAVSMGATARMLCATAAEGHAEGALIGWMLVGLALLGAVLCLYLTVVWGLAATVLVMGPASRSGSAVLGALRVLAPRLARRVSTGAAVATVATALVMVPGHAAPATAPASITAAQDALMEVDPPSRAVPVSRAEPAPPAAPAPQTARLGSGVGAAGIAPSGDGVQDDESPPALGWGEDTSSQASDASEESEPPQDAPTEDASAAPSSADPHTVIVRPGDSLWSITDDLLGAAPTDPAEIAAAWPLLHESNRDLIGPDPDHLTPGQELVVPASLTLQDTP